MTCALLLSAVLAQGGYYSPEEAASLFAQGNEAYAKGEYAGARKAFEQLLAHGQDSQDVLYNAGTAALAEGNLGHAVLYLERAAKLGGDLGDIEANLALARSRQLDQVVGAGTERTFLHRLAIATSEHAAAIALLCSLWAGFALLLLFRLLRPGRRALPAVLAIFCFLVAVPSGALVFAHAWVDREVKEGVVLAPTVAARELPSPSARVSFEVHAGLKLRVLESEGGFVKVRLPNGLEGWAAREGIADL